MGHPVAVRIELRGNNLSIEKKIPERLKVYGFGSFLERPKLGEVSMNKAAFDFLAQCPERRGLMGIEIFNGPIVSYGFAGLKLTGVGKEDVSVGAGAWKQIEKLVVVSE
jgi:hypothetical protein